MFLFLSTAALFHIRIYLFAVNFTCNFACERTENAKKLFRTISYE